jgi:hypothetical protein
VDMKYVDGVGVGVGVGMGVEVDVVVEASVGGVCMHGP